MIALGPAVLFGLVAVLIGVALGLMAVEWLYCLGGAAFFACGGLLPWGLDRIRKGGF